MLPNGSGLGRAAGSQDPPGTWGKSMCKNGIKNQWHDTMGLGRRCRVGIYPTELEVPP